MREQKNFKKEKVVVGVKVRGYQQIINETYLNMRIEAINRKHAEKCKRKKIAREMAL